MEEEHRLMVGEGMFNGVSQRTSRERKAVNFEEGESAKKLRPNYTAAHRDDEPNGAK